MRKVLSVEVKDIEKLLDSLIELLRDVPITTSIEIDPKWVPRTMSPWVETSPLITYRYYYTNNSGVSAADSDLYVGRRGLTALACAV